MNTFIIYNKIIFPCNIKLQLLSKNIEVIINPLLNIPIQ